MTGIEHIAEELEKRRELLTALPNDDNQFVWAATHLATGMFSRPKDWSPELWRALCDKVPPIRVAIAGALLAMSLDKMKEANKK